ncbi:hypothetical protein IQ256_02370 [cf. Phormidesmis sp. LEGE 11477]|nr:hypothetical protein [cf. Phormidesmis sp. LEGE 11477]
MSNSGKKLRRNFDQGHADQNFKRAISLIELHKLRFGSYPDTLNESAFRKHMGGWDSSIYRAVTYSKLEDGYELNSNSQENAQLNYPQAFWSGLGIIKTNVKGFQKSEE